MLRLELRARADELAGARDALRQWLGRSAVPPLVSRDVVIAANEALANAIEHGSASFRSIVTLTARRVQEASIVVEVHDTGHWVDRAPRPDRGRGLKIMRAVMDDVVIEPGPNGTTVTLRCLR